MLGFVGMIDPLRPGAREAVAACGEAGIAVCMITGDHPVTARAIARDLGYTRATDLIGGFDAWSTAGLPVQPCARDPADPDAPMGLGPPEPADRSDKRRIRWLSV